MDDGAQDAAWQRIEAALTRLHTAARIRSDQTELAGRLSDEQARHRALRGALRETLGRIDTLIRAHTPDDAQTPDGKA